MSHSRGEGGGPARPPSKGPASGSKPDPGRSAPEPVRRPSGPEPVTASSTPKPGRGRSAPKPTNGPSKGPSGPTPTNGGAAPQPAGPAHAGTPDPPQILEIHFKGLRKDYFTFKSVHPLGEREFVVVEADRGQDLGWVRRAVNAEDLVCEGGCESVGERSVPLPSRRVIRRAAPADLNRLLQLREQEMEVRRRTRALVKKHGLKMKVSEAEWQWDRNKLTVYFTAEKRVDFRALVREMARTFRTRIELRQIGVRDEARRLGGLGRCRRELCCRSWLPSIEPVTLQLAKDQGLSLNPSQISGACGRLMNCLRYEHAVYQQARKRFPPVGRELRTRRGREKVTAWNLFEETITLAAADGEARTIPLAELREETRSAKGRSDTTAGERASETDRLHEDRRD